MDMFLLTCFAIRERLSPQIIDPGPHRSRCPLEDWHNNRIEQIVPNRVTLVTLFMLFPHKKNKCKKGRGEALDVFVKYSC